MFKAVSGLPRGLAAILAVSLLCLPLIASADVLPQLGRNAASSIVAGQVVVQFRTDAVPSAVSNILTTYPPLRETGGLYRLAVPVGAETEVAAALMANKAVEAATVSPLIPAPSRNLPSMSQKSAPALATALRETASATPQDADTAVMPSPASGPGDTAPNTVSRFWLSDRQGGIDPNPGAENLPLVGMCYGVRFNTGRPIWANIDYANMDSQTLRVQVYSLGAFNELTSSPQEQLGYGWSVAVVGYNRASQPIPNVGRLPVGCYEARLTSSLDSSSSPPLARIRFQIVTTSPELQSTSLLWHLDHTRANDGTDPPKRWVDIKASGAWNITTGAETTIAVIGYGVNIDHPKLRDHIWSDPTHPNLHGWNFDTDTSDVTDDYGEGTFLAGLIAAEPDGSTSNGGLGVNWGTKVMPLRITRPPSQWATYGQADGTNLIPAIKWAREHHADIILVTLPVHLDANRAVDQQFKQLLYQEILLAKQANIVVVAPVGDMPPGQSDQWDNYMFPSSFPEVLTVSTTDEADRWYAAGYKNDWVDIAAPGLTHLLAINDPTLPWLDPQDRVDPAWVYGDTTFSAALVSGVVGLIRSVNPKLSPDEIQMLLRNNADKVDTANHSYDPSSQCSSGWNEYLGCGRLNAERTLWNVTHDLSGALSITNITARTPGQQCVRLENKRTGAVTWKVDVAPADQDWVTVSGPFSARSTDQTADYQGALPSFARVCVNLGTGAGRRDYGLHTAHLTVSSTMRNYGAPEKVDLSVLYAPRIYSVYLPDVSKAVSSPGQ